MHLSYHFNHNHLRRTRLLPSNNYNSSALSGYLWCNDTLVCYVSFCEDKADNAARAVTSLTLRLPTLHSPAREQEAGCVPSVAHTGYKRKHWCKSENQQQDNQAVSALIYLEQSTTKHKHDPQDSEEDGHRGRNTKRRNGVWGKEQKKKDVASDLTWAESCFKWS